MVSSKIFGTKYIAHTAYPRMLGYGTTLVMHVTNALDLRHSFRGEMSRDLDVQRFYDNQWKLLTIWNIYVQLFYAAFGLTCDVLSLVNKGKTSTPMKALKMARDHLFSAVVWPYGIAVAILFWTSFYYDPGLILPPSVDRLLKGTMNHVIHTAVVPVVLWEVVFLPRRVPSSHILNLVLLHAFAAFYLLVLTFSYMETGAWAYPILNNLNGSIYFYIFLATSVMIIHISYYLQWYLTERIWGSADKQKVQ